jgi:hypothetical protein
MVGIQRVYMAGPGFAQRLTHTSIPQMEGDQLRIYDNSAPQETPQWLVLPAEPYPVASCISGVGYNPMPMFPGRRPSYYLRGIGRIGVVPAPMSSYWLVLDIVEMPKEFDQAIEQSPFPDDFKEALAWYMASFAYHSDQSVGGDSLEADALANYNRCLAKLQSWVSNINEDDPQGPYMLTHRSFYEASAGRAGSYDGYYE